MRSQDGLFAPLREIYLADVAERDLPEFTNEVQHQILVLPWDRNTDIFHWKSAVSLPAYKARADRSGKLLQLWIARHQRSLGR